MIQFSRRTILGMLGGIVTASGCTSGPPSDSSETAVADGADGSITAVRVAGTQLVVKVAADAAIDTVNIIAPNGSTFRQLDVATGTTRVEAELGVNYQPGQYQVVAAENGEATTRERFRIAPNIEITGIGVGENQIDKLPNSLGTSKGEQAWVQVRNQGNGPIAIEKLLFLGGVPNPTTDLESAPENRSISGIFDTEANYGEVDRVLIASNERVDLFSTTLPFSFQGDGVDCPSTASYEGFRVILRTKPQGDIPTEFRAIYEPQSGGDGCTVRVSRGDL